MKYEPDLEKILAFVLELKGEAEEDFAKGFGVTREYDLRNMDLVLFSSWFPINFIEKLRPSVNGFRVSIRYHTDDFNGVEYDILTISMFPPTEVSDDMLQFMLS